MKWIILRPLEDDGSVSWVAVGSVEAESEHAALARAQRWPYVWRPQSAKAIPASRASEEVRESARREDAGRRQIESTQVVQAAAMVMLRVSAAFMEDFPQLGEAVRDRLGRTPTEEEGKAITLAYGGLLYHACCLTAEDTLSPDVSEMLRRRLDSEFPKLRFFTEGTATADKGEWAAAVQQLDDLIDASPGTSDYLQAFGRFVAALLGVPDDPEMIGRVTVSAQTTLNRLQLRRVIARAQDR